MTSRSLILTLALALGNSLPLMAQAPQTEQPHTIPAAPSKTATPAAPTLPRPLADLVKSGDFKQLQATVLKNIDELNSKEPDTAKLLENPEYAQLLCIAEIIRATGLESLSAFHGDKTRPYASAFLNRFLGNTKWMELYLGAGLVPSNTSIGLEAMADIWKKHGLDKDFETYLSLTSALGSIWGSGDYISQTIEKSNKSGMNEFDAVRRYEFFVNRHRANKLHPNFINLRPWELRFVAGHNWSEDSHDWIVSKINLPPRRYVDACWLAPYTGISFFGDSIQGPLFHMPWREEASTAQNMKERGGVCGGLSTFGVLAANVHGIPAFTVGQPGHCAYGVRVKRGDWQGGFGGPDGSAGNHIFGSIMPTSQLLMETAFADDDKIDKAYLYSFQARAMEQLDHPVQAIKAWEQALELSPVHKFFREELQRLYNEQGTMTPADWFAYATETLPKYEGNGWAAMDILADVENKFANSLSEGELLKWAKAEHELVAATQPSWAVKPDGLLEKQLSWFSTEEGRLRFLTDVFSIHLNKGDGSNFGRILEWSVQNLVESGQEKLFAKAFQDAAKSSPSNQDMARLEEIDTNKIKEYYNKAILAAEKANSIAAFQAISDAGAQLSGNKDDTATFTSKPFPGTLIPATGCLVKLSTSRWDNPLEHRDILLPRGGVTHTEEETNPWIIVELPETVRLSGIIVGKRDANQERMKKMRVSTSTDGNTWFLLDETKDMPKEWRIENRKNADARWIKVEALNDKPDFLHLRHILIYKK